MTAVKWAPNGGRLNSYRASIGHIEWVLELKRVGWVLVNLSYRMHDVFVASVSADTSIAQSRAITKARNVA